MARACAGFCTLGGLTFWAAGVVFLMGGFESRSEAVDCVEGDPISPAECIPAYATPMPGEFQGGGGAGCIRSGGTGTCGKIGQACSSTPHFNNARAGQCNVVLGGSAVFTCRSNYYITLVTLTKIQGSCVMIADACGCRYVASEPLETQNVEICTCNQTES